MSLPINILLAATVALVWLGCLSFARLPTAFDRLHCATFVNVVGGFLLTVIGFLEDGWSTRSIKIATIWIVSILAGAALSHATGRALLHRERFPAQGEEP